MFLVMFTYDGYCQGYEKDINYNSSNHSDSILEIHTSLSMYGVVVDRFNS